MYPVAIDYAAPVSAIHQTIPADQTVEQIRSSTLTMLEKSYSEEYLLGIDEKSIKEIVKPKEVFNDILLIASYALPESERVGIAKIIAQNETGRNTEYRLVRSSIIKQLNAPAYARSALDEKAKKEVIDLCVKILAYYNLKGDVDECSCVRTIYQQVFFILAQLNGDTNLRKEAENLEIEGHGGERNGRPKQMLNADELNAYKVLIERFVKPKEKYSWLKAGAIVGAVNGGIIGAGVGIYQYMHSPDMASRIKSFATTAFEVLYENRRGSFLAASWACALTGLSKAIFVVKDFQKPIYEKDPVIATKMQKKIEKDKRIALASFLASGVLFGAFLISLHPPSDEE